MLSNKYIDIFHGLYLYYCYYIIVIAEIPIRLIHNIISLNVWTAALSI